MKTIHYNYQKIRDEAWGKGSKIAERLGISKGSLSRKLRGQQQLLLEELNVIAKMVRLDTIAFPSFHDNEDVEWERSRRGPKSAK